jgi:hypothetical protein
MVDRDYVWTSAGLADARSRKIAVDEVEQALHAPPGLRYEARLGDLLLLIVGMADSARVIAVFCDGTRHTRTYRIVAVRAVSGPALDEWRRRVL